MKRLFRSYSIFVTALVAATSLPCVAAPPAAQQNLDLSRDVELERLLASFQPGWQGSVSLQAGAGYNDNLLLSHSRPERSRFARAELEALLWRLPKGRMDFVGLISAEGTRYLDRATVDHESKAFAGFEGRYRKPDFLNITLRLQGYYLDQIFDVSDTEITRVVAELKVAGVKAGPTVRWNVRSWIWLEAGGGWNRETFRDGLNNASIADCVGRLGWQPNERFEFVVEEQERRRDFDRRRQYTASGQPDDALLVVHEREIQGGVTGTWGHSRHWKTTTRAGRLQYTDNGSGYLNYTRKKVVQEIEWSAGKWLVRVEGEASRRDYELQTVGRGISPPQQLKEEYSALLRIERKLTDRWTLFAEYSWERSRSNEVIASYVVNEGLLGARWSWDK